MMDWQHEGKPPLFDDINTYQVRVNGQARTVRRVGNKSRSLTPGTLVFLDCDHAAQNGVCDESMIQAWRRHAPRPPSPRARFLAEVRATHMTPAKQAEATCLGERVRAAKVAPWMSQYMAS